MDNTEIRFGRDFIVALNGGAERMITCVVIYDADGNEYRSGSWLWHDTDRSTFETIRRIPFRAISEPDYDNDRGFLIERYDCGGYETNRKKYKLYISAGNIDLPSPSWSLVHDKHGSAKLVGLMGDGGTEFVRDVNIPEADRLWNEWNRIIKGEYNPRYRIYEGGIQDVMYGPELDAQVSAKLDRLIEVRGEYAELIRKLEDTPVEELVRRYA